MDHLLQPLCCLPCYQDKRNDRNSFSVTPSPSRELLSTSTSISSLSSSLSSCPEIRKAKKRDIRRRCRICHSKTAYYCVSCSSVELDAIVPICNPLKLSQASLPPTCYAKHIDMHIGQ